MFRNSNKPLLQIVKCITELGKAGTNHAQKHVLMGETTFFLKSGAIAEVCHVGSNVLYSWNILLPHQIYSFFKEPFDSKMIKIH